MISVEHWADTIWNFYHNPSISLLSANGQLWPHIWAHICEVRIAFLPVHDFTFIYIEFYLPFYCPLTDSFCGLSPLILTTLNNLTLSVNSVIFLFAPFSRYAEPDRSITDLWELHWWTLSAVSSDHLVFCFPSFNNYLPMEGSSLLSHGCLVSLKAFLRNMVESFLETQVHVPTKPSSSLWLLSPSKKSDSAWCRFPFTKKNNLGSSKEYHVYLFNNSIPYYSFYHLVIGEALYRNMPLLIMVWLWQCDCVLSYFSMFFVECHKNITAQCVSVEGM